jgi:hypothetical protein
MNLGPRTYFWIFIAFTGATAWLASGTLSQHGTIRLLAWGAGGSAVLSFLASLGITPWRALLDDYNRGNLQQAITTSWFVLLSSALLAGSFINIFAWTPAQNAVAPFFVRIDASVWVLAGIALGGAVINRVIDTVHADAVPANNVTESAWAAESDRRGRMFVKAWTSNDEARKEGGSALPATTFDLMGDMLQGRQKGTETKTELGPVQQLLLQATTLVGYAVAVGAVLYGTPHGQAVSALPTLPAELLTLLGVSAAGQAALAAVPVPSASGKPAG